jgi:SAM-dependent methyltransferase
MNGSSAPFDAEYYQSKMQRFQNEFDIKAISWLIDQMSGQSLPTRLVTPEDVTRDYSFYSQLLVDSPEVADFACTWAPRLKPFLQAPFPLPTGEVIQGPWLGQYKIDHFKLFDITPETIAGKRVLDIGCNAGFDTFYLSTLGPGEIIGIEPVALFYTQALFLWSIYNCCNLDFRRLGWQDARSAGLGTFGIVNCQGILYHEPSPMQLIEMLFDLLEPGGKLALETHISLGDEMLARFIPGTFNGDTSWFWLPTLRTLREMLSVRGFVDVVVHDWYPFTGPNPDDPDHSAEGEQSGGRAFLTAIKPSGKVYAPKYGIN